MPKDNAKEGWDLALVRYMRVEDVNWGSTSGMSNLKIVVEGSYSTGRMVRRCNQE